MYYLQSRYYDAAIGRFISADAYAMTYETPVGANMFAYCGNNPVIHSDPIGEYWHILAGAGVGAVYGFASSVISDVRAGKNVNIKAAGISAAFGAVGGAVTAVGLPNLATSVVVGGILSGVSEAADQYVRYGEITNFTDVAISTAAGAVGAGFSGNGALADLNVDKYVSSQMTIFKTSISKGKPFFSAASYALKMTKTTFNKASLYAAEMVGGTSVISSFVKDFGRWVSKQ